MKKLLLPNMDGCDKVCCVSHRSPPQFFKNPVFNTSDATRFVPQNY